MRLNYDELGIENGDERRKKKKIPEQEGDFLGYESDPNSFPLQIPPFLTSEAPSLHFLPLLFFHPLSLSYALSLSLSLSYIISCNPQKKKILLSRLPAIAGLLSLAV